MLFLTFNMFIYFILRKSYIDSPCNEEVQTQLFTWLEMEEKVPRGEIYYVQNYDNKEYNI